MQPSTLLWVLLLLTAIGYHIGRNRAISTADGRLSRLHSVPSYHGVYVALWGGLPTLMLLILWSVLQAPLTMALTVGSLPDHYLNADPVRLNLLKTDILNLAKGIVALDRADPMLAEAARHYNGLRAVGDWCLLVVGVTMALAGIRLGLARISLDLRARNRVERVLDIVLIACSLIAILTTIGIVLSLFFEAMVFFSKVPLDEFLFGLRWSPQIAMRSDQTGSSGAFGAVPLFTGTLLITLIAMVVAVPTGLMAAVYMSEYAPLTVRNLAKPILEILAGIPTVVYGFFAALTMAPVIRQVFGADGLGLDVSSESALAAGVVMGVMIIPFVSSLSDDVINAVPQSLRDGSYGLGATKSETIRLVVLPAALPGIVAAVMLAISRAIGETMIVTMAAGLTANLTANPFEAVTTVTVQIATLLVGDQEFDSPKTLSAFGLGLVLFLVTLCLNVIALRVVQKYREKYD